MCERDSNMSGSGVAMLMLKLLEDSLVEQGIQGARIKLTAKATGSRGQLSPPGSNHGDGTQERAGWGSQNLGFTSRGRELGRVPPCPTAGLFSPSRHPQGCRKDADQSLRLISSQVCRTTERSSPSRSPMDMDP